MMTKKVFLFLFLASGLIHLSSGSISGADSEDVSDTTFSVLEDSDPFPAWRLMWNLLGINIFLLSMVYTVISILEKFYLERRGFYDFEMEDWRMD